MTIERINAILGTNFTLTKRNGMPNEGNIRIMSRLHDITEEEIRRFMREDEGWNWSPREKHDRGYHALRALDKWYRENGHGSGSDGTDYDNGGSGMPYSDYSDGDATPTDGSTESTGDSGAGSGDADYPTDSGSNGSDGAGSGDADGTEEGSDGSGTEEGDGNGNADGNGNGNADSGDNADGNGNSDSNTEETDSDKPDGTDDKPSDEPKPNKPSEKLTDTERRVKALIEMKRRDGAPNNVYLFGPAGTGKSYMVKRIAEVLGAGYWEVGQFTMKEELLGFKTANGDYAETEFVRLLKHGTEGKALTVMLFDEFDGNSNAVTLAFNNIFASRRFTTPEGTFNVHPSIRFVATGNTTMDGSDEDYDRESADKSVKTRWLFEEVQYDKNIEKKLTDKETVRFLQGLRKAKDKIGLELMVTYREFTALDYIEELIKEGIYDRESALNTCVFKGLTEDDKDNLRRDQMMAKLISEGNRWAVAL